jgi:hypothetical protein
MSRLSDMIDATQDDIDALLRGDIKYLSRAGRKGGNSREQDLRKAAWFCTKGAQVCEDTLDLEEPSEVRTTLTREQVIAIWNQALFTDALKVARQINEGTWKRSAEDEP